MKTFIAAMLAVVLMVGSAVAAPETLRAFYGEHPERTQADFISRLKSSDLKMDKERLVALFNQEFGRRIAPVSTFDELAQKLASADYEVRPCVGTIVNYGLTSRGEPKVVKRPCHAAEMMLVHKASGLAVFSLDCGNLQRPPPENECMEITLHLVGNSGQPVTPLLRVWGASAGGCGLRAAPCVCIDASGRQASAAFYAPSIRGAVGVIRLPRALAEAFDKICVEIPGYLHGKSGMRDIIIQNALREQFNQRARAGLLSLQLEGHYLEFRLSS